MARAVWKGLINFGLVNIPIELHSGTRDHMPRFRLLHRTDMSPISLERVCQTEDLLELPDAPTVKMNPRELKREDVKPSKAKPAKQTNVVDLVARLQESLAAARRGRGGEKAVKARSRSRPRPRTTAKKRRAA